MELQDSATYPMERDDWIKTVLIGGILVFFSFLIIPIIIAYGYVVRTIRGSLKGDAEPPAFGEWGDLAVDGVQAWIIAIVYQLVPLIVATVTIGGSIGAVVGGGEAGAAAGVGGAALGLTISSILALAFGYLGLAAIVNFAREERFGAAFDFDTIKRVVLGREFAVAWLVSVAVFIVAGIVTMIPILGWIIAPFVGFYAAIVAANLLAGGFARTMDLSPETDPTSGETAV